MITTLLFVGFLLCSLVQLVFWLGIFRRLATYSVVSQNIKKEAEPVSVIICAHNEAENLKKNLHRFLNQNYRSFEIVVVNDNSTDDTADFLLDIQIKYTNLECLNIEEATPPGKKRALEKGIEAATHDLLLLTDADCAPRSKNWISQMQSAVSDDIVIGLGYSPYFSESSALNIFIRFETIYTAIQYLSFALAGLPYMGVGRNLIYRRTVFEQAGGFQKHAHIASGDDDLLINATATNQNTRIVLHPESFTDSIPKKSWRSYYYQKARHLTTGSKYKPVHQFLLGLLAFSHFGHYFFGLSLATSPTLPVVTLFYLVRIGIVWSMYGSILRKLEDRSLWPWIPLLDIAYLLYYVVFAPVLVTGNKQKWK